MIEPFISRDEQIDILKKALDLYKKADVVDEKLDHTEYYENFTLTAPTPPTEPIKKEFVPLSYPEPQSNLSFMEHLKTVKTWIWVIGFLTYGILAIALLIIKGIEFYNLKKSDEETIKRTPQYLAQCAEIDAQNAELQRQADADYQKEYAKYLEDFKQYQNNELLKYETEKKLWQEAHNKKIKAYKTRIKQLENEANALLEEKNLLPKQYRKLSAVEHIYDDLTSSDISLKQAIKKYDEYVNTPCSNKLFDAEAFRKTFENNNQQQAPYQEPVYVEDNNITYTGGLLRNAISTAAGVAAANKLAKQEEKKNKYKDFMGSASCIYGKKLNGYTRESCNSRCPVYDYCTRGRGKYKK